ncbi:ribokinase [Lactovum odontotermitis]
MTNMIVVGSIAMDLVTSTEIVPNQGETVLGREFSMVPGGKGANQAVAAARLAPNEVAMIGAVGEDTFGQVLKENLIRNNIFTENVGTVSHSTGIAQITLFDNDNRIIVVPGANNEVRLAGDDLSILDNAALVVLQNEIPHQTNLTIAEYCKEKNIKVLYNPAPARETDLEMIDYADFITPNEHECAQMFPSDSLEEALKKYPNKLIVTQGVSGVSFYDAEKIIKVPAIKADVVDTTGAGDTFNGAFGFAVTRGLANIDAVKFAVIASHLSVQKFGAQGGMPTLKEIKEHPAYEEKWNLK